MFGSLINPMKRLLFASFEQQHCGHPWTKVLVVLDAVGNVL